MFSNSHQKAASNILMGDGFIEISVSGATKLNGSFTSIVNQNSSNKIEKDYIFATCIFHSLNFLTEKYSSFHITNNYNNGIFIRLFDGTGTTVSLPLTGPGIELFKSNLTEQTCRMGKLAVIGLFESDTVCKNLINQFSKLTGKC